jgi:hypothetical protein
MTMAVLQHWWEPDKSDELAMKRRKMRVSLKNYSFRVPALEDVPADLNAYLPEASMLANAYRSLVATQEIERGKVSPTAATVTLAFGMLFAEMWASVAHLALQVADLPEPLRAVSTDAPDVRGSTAKHLLALAMSLPSGPVVEWVSQETVATASLLADAYLKSLADLKVIAATSTRTDIAVRHHVSLASQSVADMAMLAMECGEPLDLLLPDSHLHKQVTLAQMRARPRSHAT